MFTRTSATRALARALRTARALGVAAAMLASLSCSNDDGTGPGSGACSEDVEISVATDGTPVFTWSPACGVAALLVESVSGGDVWVLDAEASSGIASGVTYGVVPPGAVEEEPALALEDGETYFVLVARVENGDLVLAGLRSFAP